jgi:hypothetical protein
MEPRKTCDYNHLILYAKGHYKRTDLLADLKLIVAERCALDPEHVSNNDVWQVVSSALIEHASKRQMEEYLGRLFQKGIWDYNRESVISFAHDDDCPIRRALGMVTGILAHLPVLDKDGNVILELGQPDPKVLPLKEKDK